MTFNYEHGKSLYSASKWPILAAFFMAAASLASAPMMMELCNISNNETPEIATRNLAFAKEGLYSAEGGLPALLLTTFVLKIFVNGVVMATAENLTPRSYTSYNNILQLFSKFICYSNFIPGIILGEYSNGNIPDSTSLKAYLFYNSCLTLTSECSMVYVAVYYGMYFNGDIDQKASIFNSKELQTHFLMNACGCLPFILVGNLFSYVKTRLNQSEATPHSELGSGLESVQEYMEQNDEGGTENGEPSDQPDNRQSSRIRRATLPAIIEMTDATLWGRTKSTRDSGTQLEDGLLDEEHQEEARQVDDNQQQDSAGHTT